MLQKIDQDRLEAILRVIDECQIKFPVAEISKRTDYKKGTISLYLSGKKAISDNFFQTFMKEFAHKL